MWEYLWLIAHVTAAGPDGNGHSLGIVRPGQFRPAELQLPEAIALKQRSPTSKNLRREITSNARGAAGRADQPRRRRSHL